MKKQVMYAGNHPEKDKGWVQWGEVRSDGLDWVFYFQPQQKSSEWVTIKVCAKTKAPAKGNYWFAKNTATGKIAFAKDLKLMQETKPDLHIKVMKIVEECF